MAESLLGKVELQSRDCVLFATDCLAYNRSWRRRASEVVMTESTRTRRLAYERWWVSIRAEAIGTVKMTRIESDRSEVDRVILIPVFDDWAALHLLLANLDAVLDRRRLPASVLVVDDASTTRPDEDFCAGPFEAIEAIEVLPLKRNLGHQRAIAIGLAFIEEHISCRAVVVMDSDGEDAPSDVPRLLDCFEHDGSRRIVFAERTRRSESLTFVLFYNLYKLLHLVLTGIAVRVGNFSVIPQERLSSLVVVSELWSHYPAAVFKSLQPFCTLRTVRARRLSGRSHMNFVRLVVHGLSALSVFSDIIGVRVLIATLVVILLSIAGMVGTVFIRLATNLAIPGWATNLAGILMLIMLQAMMFSVLFSFVIIGGRQSMTFLPCRDYKYFVLPLRTLYRKRCTNLPTSATS